MEEEVVVDGPRRRLVLEPEPVPALELVPVLELALEHKLELERLQRKDSSGSEKLVEQLVEPERCNLVADSVVERKLSHRTSVSVGSRSVQVVALRKVVLDRREKSRKRSRRIALRIRVEGEVRRVL
jgi:hypothetical protein